MNFSKVAKREAETVSKMSPEQKNAYIEESLQRVLSFYKAKGIEITDKLITKEREIITKDVL